MVAVISTKIADVLLIQLDVYGDDRGYFIETYQQEKYNKVGIPHAFVQDNMSLSRQGVLRGLHYQIQQPQGKLVQVLKGKIFDLCVDIRKSSPTFRQWVGAELSNENNRQLWVPPGFAHGFYVLSEEAYVTYKTTDFYAPQWERTILWNDPELGIEWPLQGDIEPVVSGKDTQGKLLSEAELFD
ncbi:MAG: dTDP-4-dehydrorhamnose 3,5-epimerase [Anaerolineales bacterium]|nr:dTDP-4-dehydrorhamnose 3,5-epimerase [Anaerolineales bacterium]